ncbi:hypothetical protein [Pantoea sp. RIT-PI-b]|uniref:hypothetical protein n=1 Tax=Pantoea sp. RIT-PI-b TaxID=1681195 RepID=UPI00128FA4C1|nr:hypothetical protein [Pantoea sp. RIT-PI-b]
MEMTLSINELSVRASNMRVNSVTKWLHCAITVSLLIGFISLLWLNTQSDNPANDTLQNSHRISDHLWLYTTMNDSGGATVSTLYRYYLSDHLLGTNQHLLMELKKQIPFMEGYGSISSIKQDAKDSVRVVYSGNILSLDNETSYSVDGHPLTIKLSYQIN